MKVLLIGSNFLSAHVFVRLMGFNNMEIIVLDRKDPTTILNFNNDVYRIFKKYCKGFTYRNLYDGTEFGDKKRNIKIRFLFRDWVHESLGEMVCNVDIIFHCGSIYDPLYAAVNERETLNVNVMGFSNLMSEMHCIAKNTPVGNKTLFVDMTSINVYGDQSTYEKEMITEDETIPNPQNLLDFTLYTQENMLKSMAEKINVDFIILRLGTMIGNFTPTHSLVNAAVAALLLQHPIFDVYNSEDSIELLDADDFGQMLNVIIQMYISPDTGHYEKIINQVYNIKSEESEPKTVRTIAESVMATASRLPQLTSEHYKEMGIPENTPAFRLKSPKIKFINSGKSKIRFNSIVSGLKAAEKLGFKSSQPLVMTMLPRTVNYLLNYILADFSEADRMKFQKIFYLPSLPTPETTPEYVNKDVKDFVEKVNDEIEKDLS